MPWIILDFASGINTSLMIIHGVAPTAIAASITPLSISRKDVSTIRAKNGIAATDKATLAAVGPIELPTTIFVNGVMATIKMMKGMERTILTTMPSTDFTGLFSRNRPLSVTN